MVEAVQENSQVIARPRLPPHRSAHRHVGGNARAIGEAFHITSDEVLTWNQIHELVASAAGVKPELVHLPSELIARFVARHPAITVDARLTNRNVDLVAEGFDLALRAAVKPMKDSSMVVRKVTPVELHIFASPTYLARRGAPR